MIVSSIFYTSTPNIKSFGAYILPLRSFFRRCFINTPYAVQSRMDDMIIVRWNAGRKPRRGGIVFWRKSILSLRDLDSFIQFSTILSPFGLRQFDIYWRVEELPYLKQNAQIINLSIKMQKLFYGHWIMPCAHRHPPHTGAMSLPRQSSTLVSERSHPPQKVHGAKPKLWRRSRYAR